MSRARSLHSIRGTVRPQQAAEVRTAITDKIGCEQVKGEELERELATLTILAEVTVAFVAFSAIVASLRVTLGKKLTDFQNLLVHFFTESEMLGLSLALLPLVLSGFWQEELIVARYTLLYTIVSTTTYLIYYVRRRLKIGAPTPLPSLVVMIGYGIWIAVLAVTLTEIFWQPSLAIIAAFCLWALCSGAVIFVSFLATFVDREGEVS